jgi:hypothetical protein
LFVETFQLTIKALIIAFIEQLISLIELLVLKRLVVQHLNINGNAVALICELQRIRHEVYQDLNKPPSISVNLLNQAQIIGVINDGPQIDFSFICAIVHHLQSLIDNSGKAEVVIVKFE